MSIKHFSVLIIFLLFLLSGCIDFRGIHGLPPEIDYQIAPQFREFYKQLGSENIMGKAISPAFSHDGFWYQYTYNGLLVYNERATSQAKLTLAPLGIEMGFFSILGLNANEWQRTEFSILEEFIPIYDGMGGVSVVGRALTPPRLNPSKLRYEQYFENLGFYRSVNDPPGMVHLLAYGAWKCATRCQISAMGAADVLVPSEIDNRFITHINLLDINLTGYPVTPSYLTKDGLVVQVFDHMILGLYENKPEALLIQSLTNRLGIMPDPMKPPSENKDMIFINVLEGRGYQVPHIFLEFIEKHGDFNVIGLPISDFKMVQEKLYRQCFVNLCIEEDRRVEGRLRIHPSPLGYNYAQVLHQMNSLSPKTPDIFPGTITPTLPVDSSEQVTLQVWEMHPWVSTQNQQEIELRVSFNGKPIRGVKPYIHITYPDQKIIRQEMPLTNHEGRSSILLAPINVANGTLIAYQVCIPLSGEASFCSKGDFLVMDISGTP